MKINKHAPSYSQLYKGTRGICA